MSFRIKKGKGAAKVQGLRPEILLAIIIAKEVFEQHGYECVVTGVTEPGHKSIVHPLGCGADFRSRHLTPVAKNEVSQAIADKLSDEYDVVPESDHIHVEFDPR